MSNEKNINLVIVSATSDNNLRNDIENHLTHSNINVWHTGKIQAGINRKGLIKEKLEKADIVVPLISADFWTDKSRRNELQGFIMPIIRTLEKQKNIRIVPILAKPYPWEITEFKLLQVLPSTGKPIATGSKRTDDLVEIALALTNIANETSPTQPIVIDLSETTTNTTPKKEETKVKKTPEKPIVFIVHGHNDAMKDKVELFVRQMNFEPIVLHKQVNKGRTIIEKFEDYASKTAFAIVILSADDYGYAKKWGAETKKQRARQNVVFEFGFFAGSLGREKVLVLQETSSNFEAVGDYSGVIYVSYEEGNWNLEIAREMKSAGLPVDLNRLYQF